jgi:RNA 3'-terminal phosphate cyclase (ATP)
VRRSRRGGVASFTCTELTEHATTNVGTIERFLPVRFAIECGTTSSRVTVAARM